MIKIHFYTMPDDECDHRLAEHAHHAWSAVNESLEEIRKYQKYETGTPEQCLSKIKVWLTEARSRIEP